MESRLTVVLLVSLVVGGCAAATAPAVPPGLQSTGPAPTRPDRGAGLVGIANGFELRGYQAIAVDRFEVSDASVQGERDRAAADRAVALLHAELLRQLAATGLFPDVINLAGGIPAGDGRPILRLEGAVTRFDPGSATLRYFVGLGTGRSTVEVLTRFVDGRSREVVMVTFDRRVSPFDFFGGSDHDGLGDSVTALARGLADFLARLARGEAPQPKD